MSHTQRLLVFERRKKKCQKDLQYLAPHLMSKNILKLTHWIVATNWMESYVPLKWMNGFYFKVITS